MKKLFLILMVVFLVVGLFGLTGCTTSKSKTEAKDEPGAMKGLGPVLVLGTPLVKMSKTSKVVVMGTGFKPGEEVRVLFTSPDGLQSDIGYALKPEPKVNKSGTWGTTWSAGRYVSRKLIKGGVYTMTAADGEYNPIAAAPVTFAKPKAKKKKK